MPLTDSEKTELLDWVSACQSAYERASNPRGPFRPLPDELPNNRNSLVEYVGGLLAEREERLEKTRSALAGLVGESDPENLRTMLATLAAIPARDPEAAQDKAAAITAIEALLETAT